MDIEKILKKIVREEVRREVQRAVSQLCIREIVQETIRENIGRNSVPSPMDNSDKGIYSKSPLMHDDDDDEPVRESVNNKLLSVENPFSALYETVRSAPPQPAASVRVESLPGAQRYASILKAAERRAEEKKPMTSHDPEAKLREIALRRQALDAKVVG